VVLGHQLQLLVMAVPAPVRAPSLLPHETRRLHTAQLHVQMASAVAGVGMGVAMAVTSTKPVPPLHRSPELPKAGTRHQSMDRDGPGMAHALLRPRCRSPWPSSWSTTAAGLLCWCNIFSFPWCSSAATSIDGCLEQSGNARGAGHLQCPPHRTAGQSGSLILALPRTWLRTLVISLLPNPFLILLPSLSTMVLCFLSLIVPPVLYLQFSHLFF
jgi:hypothetical protein